MRRRLFACIAMAAMASAVVAPVSAQIRQDNNKRPAGTPQLPQCAQPIGTVSIQEPQQQWWRQYNLGSPEALIKLMASRSNCLRVVDRNGGLQMRNAERDLGADLQRGSNVGAGQVLAADYAIIPDIANANRNAGGNAAVIGGLIGGPVGGLIGGIRTQRSEANTLLTLVNIRTTVQEHVSEGTAQKTDISFGGGGFGGLVAGAGGGYGNTEIGQVIAAAYLNAFIDLIGYMQNMQPGQAQASAPIQTYVVKTAVQMRETPSPAAKMVRSFNVGDSVFPTGQKNGVWWEVDDETGNRGWVSSVMIGPK